MPEVTARNAGHAFALVLADELARHGVTDAVLAPGSRSTPIALAFAGDDRINLHVRIDERSASYAALGIAKTSGRPVPVLCTSGTAAAHLHGAMLEADLSRVPLLVLTADRPPELRGVGANQTVDQVGIYGNAARWSCDVGVPESRADSVRYWRSLTSRAVAASRGLAGAPPGPVHLNLPLREPLTPVDDGAGFAWPLDGRPEGAPWTIATAPARPVPAALRDRVATARRGVLVVGDGPTPADASALASFAARAGWPLIAEPHSNARQGGAALRATDALLGDDAFVAANVPDLVVVIGRVGLSRALLGWLSQMPTVTVDPHGAWWDPSRTTAEIVACDAAELATVDASADTEWLAPWVAASSRASTAIDGVLEGEMLLSEPLAAREVAAAVSEGGALVVASSMPIRDLDQLMQPRDGVRVVANRGVSGIDGFVSTATGVAAAHDGPVVALAGDLSLLHDASGLVADPRPDVTIVVLNNDGGGIFSLLPQSTGGDAATFERLFGTPHGVDIAALSAAYGAEHRLVSTTDELVDSVVKPTAGFRIVEVRSDRAANAELHARMRAAAADAVR